MGETQIIFEGPLDKDGAQAAEQVRDQKVGRVLRCQKSLHTAPQQSPRKKSMGLTSAQVFKDE